MNPASMSFARCLRCVAVAAIAVATPIARSSASPTDQEDLPPHAVALDLGAGVSIEFVLISAGSFLMGSPKQSGEGDESPRHRVTITQPFYLGKHEVTQEQWQRLMDANPSNFKGAKLPVDSVSWHDCQRFLEKLGTATGQVFALPTEAQWEYAARAGATTRWSFGDEPALAGRHAWFAENSRGTSHPVGTKAANAWGLHDLHGNIAEWCADWYAAPYPRSDVVDPRGPPAGDSRVVRGGAWGDDAIFIRSAYRNANGPDGANDGIGFRCVMLLDRQPDGPP